MNGKVSLLYIPTDTLSAPLLGLSEVIDSHWNQRAWGYQQHTMTLAS